MIKDFKYILKRVIIGLGIALVIYFLRGGLIADVSALEPYNDIPNTITYWSSTESGITASVKEFNKFNTQWFGYTFDSDQSMQGWSFNFDGESYLDDKSGSVNFAIYSNVKNEWRKPFQVYIKDFYNNISSCYVDGTSNSQNGSLVSSPVSSVICPNVQVRGNYSIFISNLTSNIANTIGISKVTFKFSTDKDIKDSIDKSTQEQEKTNNTLNDSNVDNATSDGSSFFGNFSSDSHGLSGIITAPLRLINSLTTATCKPLEFNLPFVGNHVVLPCMRSIYENHFGIFFSLWQLITTGLISYNVCINLYSKVRNLQNPNNDRIEVLNL